MAQAKTEFRLAMSPLSHTIYAGRVKDAGNGCAIATGVRHDVTNDFLGLIIQYGHGAKGGAFEIVGGGEVWDVTVTKRAAVAKVDAGERRWPLAPQQKGE